MKTSPVGIALIKHFESLHDGDLSIIGLQPKMCPAGIWTKGWGSAIIDPRTGKFLKGKENRDYAYKIGTVKDESEANKLLDEALKKFEARVQKRLTKPVNQNQFDALVSHTYNTGGSDGLFKLVNTTATPEKIRTWFETRYITADGVVKNGLIRRRKAEADLFFK